MNQLSREAVTNAFSKKQQKDLKIPDLDAIDWKNIDYLGWIHRSGHLGYIVYEFDGKLIGIRLNVEKTLNDNKYKICSLCLTQHLGNGTSLFTSPNPVRKNEVTGDYLCANLNCGLYLRGIEKSEAIQLREDITREQKIERYLKNLRRFIIRSIT
ncbi:MAG: FBP domain-containing protein [Chloroflexota bacterium]